MLQFWKKSANKTNQKAHLRKYSLPENRLINEVSHTEPAKVSPPSLLEDEGLFDIGEVDCKKERSRLSKTLQEILSDKTALVYFLQYMESQNASPYILCWLDIDSFKLDLNVAEDRTKTLPSVSPLPSNTTHTADHDSLSVSTDSDSYTADSHSFCDCSTATLSETKVSQEKCLLQDTNGVCDSISSDNSCSNKLKSEETNEAVEHALEIFKKYIALEATHNINCTEKIRKGIMENICDKDKVLSGHCFDSVQDYIYNTMKNDYLQAFLGTDYFCKHQIDVLTSGNVVLEDILYNETALFYFMEFLEQENQRSLLDFWIAATNLHQQLHDQKDFFDPIEAQNDAIVLYDKYFSLQAHCPLGFSDKVRLAVEQSICGENGLLIDCFHLPLKIVEQVLEKNYLKPFLASQLFYKYLSELISTVQANGYSTNIEHKNHLPSDCSSERSFSTSTFLALEVPNNINRKKEKTDMSIDTRELYDPDSLWKRKRIHRLSLGRVTELGKYVADIEPEPDKKEFRLKDMVKKFVSLDEEEKRKEEMAWQVAEMIVKDITSVTLSDKN